MYLVFARKYLVHTLKSTFSQCNLSSSACVGVCSKACNYSTSCQPSLEVGDSSVGEVHEESRVQKSGCAREIIEEKKEELVLKTQVCFKACNYSTSCQPSLEVGDGSAGEVREESRIHKNDINEEKKEELVFKTQLVEKVQPHLKRDQEEGLKKSPLKVIVQSYVRRWFKEHLRNAEKGNSDAQVIVGQMISHGYGVPKDVRKGEEWIRRAPRRQKQSKESSEKKRSQDEDLYFM